MEFNIVVGNPPYQLETGGVNKSAMPLYDKVIERVILLRPKYISMIIPSRWACGGKSVLDRFRRDLIASNRLVEIHNYFNSVDVFENVSIAGGVMYFLWDRDKEEDGVIIYNYRGSERVTKEDSLLSKYEYKGEYLIILDNIMRGIIDKVRSKDSKTMSNIVHKRKPFGIDSRFEDSDKYTDIKNIKVICSGGRVVYTDIGNILRNKGLVGDYKVICNKIKSDGGGFKGGKYNVIARPRVLSGGEVCSESYLMIGSNVDINVCKNIVKYISTKFVRSLVLSTITSVGVSRKNFIFVPIQDFSSNGDINWDTSIVEIDKQLYKKYSLTDAEVEYIESIVKGWGDGV